MKLTFNQLSRIKHIHRVKNLSRKYLRRKNKGDDIDYKILFYSKDSIAKTKYTIKMLEIQERIYGKNW